MTKTELERYKSTLETKKAELSANLRNREDIAIEKTPDAIDEVQLAGERELASRLPFTIALESPAERASGPDSNSRRQLWHVHALRGRDQPQATERGAVDGILHQMPGSRRP